MRTTPRSAAVAAAVFVCAASPAALAQQQQTFYVDCSIGQKISTVLLQGDPRKATVIIVRGNCTEHVSITRDDVTLRGDPPLAASVRAPTGTAAVIDIRGSRAVVEGLMLYGGVNGIAVSNAHGVQVRNCTISGAAANGLFVSTGFVNLQNSTIQNNGYSGVDSGRAGLFLRRASIRMESNTIALNAGAGIHAEQNSAVSAGVNTIRENVAQGIMLLSSSTGSLSGDASLGNLLISNNGGNGVELGLGSQAWLSRAAIIGNKALGIYALLSQVSAEQVAIADSAGHGVLLETSAGSFSGGSITGNGGRGIDALTASTVTTGGEAAIRLNGSNGVRLSLNSTGSLDTTYIQSNGAAGIRLQFGSRLLASGGALNGNAGLDLDCRDSQSSYRITGGGSPSPVISATCIAFSN